MARTLRITAIGAGLIATAMCYAHVDLIDVKSPEMQMLEERVQKERDKEIFHRGNRPEATDKEREAAYEAFVRNTD